MQLSLRLLLVFILLAGFSCAPKPGPAEKASELVQAWMEETHAVGVTVSVGRDGEIIWSQGFGYADLEQDVPVDPGKTLFRVGSVAKSMTATAVGILYEAGKLDLDAPVQTYVPGFPQKQGVITPRLLGGHIAGIRHYQGDENLSNVPYDSVTASLAIFKDDPLLHAPGSKYHYSSYGFNLLSAVVEGASGEDFLSFMDEEVFKPFDMQHTVADKVYSIIPGRGRYYWVDDAGTVSNAPAVDNSYKWAGGGLISTSEDLVRMGFGYLNHTVLKPETTKLLWTPQTLTNGEQTDYGIGWRRGENHTGRPWVGHGGGSVGGSTRFEIYPEENLVVAVISNRSDQDWNDISFKVAELFLE